jgi:exopolyphosphatase / guanosine-5'-triphosphate,3'-diphosphate pyrophosphatase
VRPELLAGEAEARLEFLGATAGLTEPGPYLVVDVGGGSTEIIVGTDEPEGLRSLDIGCVRLTEQFLHSDPPTAEELSQAVSVVRDELADVARQLPAAGRAPTLVGTAGTVWTLAAIELGVDTARSDLIDHFRLTRAAAEEVFRTLATEPVEQRRHNPGLEPGRVDVIVGGAIIVVSVMRHWGFDALLVSEADILDGLARDSA